MEINGFWIDSKTLRVTNALRNSKAKAGLVADAVNFISPNHRKINCEQDFRDFVDALVIAEEAHLEAA